MLLMLRVRPRAHPLGWPHTFKKHPTQGGVTGVIDYEWVTVHPDGSGWSLLANTPGDYFPERDLDAVLERFYENAGPYPFDCEVIVVGPEIAPAAARKRAAKRKRKKR